MRIRIAIWFVVVAFLLALPLACGKSASEPAPGKEVFAESGPDSWHHGRIMEKCPGGWSVQLDGLSEGCFASAKVILDQPPMASAIKPGLRVLAQFQNGNFIPAVVKSNVETIYNVEFADGELGVANLTQLRLLP